METYRYRSSLGPVLYTAATPFPEALIVHGFGRRMADVETWGGVFKGAGFLHLPGHGGAPDIPGGVRAWADAFGELVARFRRRPVVIGESLGAVLSLTIPARAVIAVEPLLSVDVWSLPPSDLFAEPFGWALDRITAPTLVLAGNEPLLPRREGREPSVLSDADFDRFAAHHMVTARRIPGGHALLSHAHAAVIEAALPFLAALDETAPS